MIFDWGPSPILLSIGPLTIRWYGLLFVSGFLIGHYNMCKIFRRENWQQIKVDSLLMHLLIGTAIGARLGHCLFYEPHFYLSHPLKILYIWEGGLASHGAMIGNLTALWIFVNKNKELGFFKMLDRLAYPAALAGFFIRIGNFVNSEIIGKPTDGIWGVVFSNVDFLPRHPAQLYEAFAYVILYFILHHAYWKTKISKFQGRLFGIWLVYVFCARFIIEFFKENQSSFEANMPINMGQLLSLPFIFIGGFLVWKSVTKK